MRVFCRVSPTQSFATPSPSPSIQQIESGQLKSSVFGGVKQTLKRDCKYLQYLPTKPSLSSISHHVTELTRPWLSPVGILQSPERKKKKKNTGESFICFCGWLSSGACARFFLGRVCIVCNDKRLTDNYSLLPIQPQKSEVWEGFSPFRPSPRTPLIVTHTNSLIDFTGFLNSPIFLALKRIEKVSCQSKNSSTMVKISVTVVFIVECTEKKKIIDSPD